MSRPSSLRRPLFFGLPLLLIPLWVGAYPTTSSELPTRIVSASNSRRLSANDISWLRRDGFGLDSATLARYQLLGRTRFLDQQLSGHEDPLPAPIQALIDSYIVANTSPAQLLADYRERARLFKQTPAGPAKDAAKKALQAYRRELSEQTAQVELLHAVYGSNQLKEQMVWFWLNHFSVYAAKGRVRIFAADYTKNTIRPHALGKFRDLVLATLKSPAMLEFLDNAKNVKGKTNENYARELMELHTLGVGSGYTQQDVQQLAMILTGAGIVQPRQRRGNRFGRDPFDSQRPGMLRDGLFEFDPNRHDFGDKTFLGQTIKGGGFGEIERALDLIVSQPACAHFISQQLAEYFVSDQPPATLVDAMARTFQSSGGDIAAVLRTMFLSREITAGSEHKFKDPARFTISAMRLAYDGRPINNAAPMVNWLKQMGEPLYGRITPDGWPLDSSSWSGSGQMSKRFDVARIIGSGRSKLLDTGTGPVAHVSPPIQTSALFRNDLQPYLSEATRTALDKAKSPLEWNTFLLSSPDFNYR